MRTEVEQDPSALDLPIAFPRPGEGYGLGGCPFRDEQLGAWVVSAYADVDRVVRDGETFSSKDVLGPDRRETFGRLMAQIREDPRLTQATTYMKGLGDGDGHRRMRSFVNKAFTPARVKGYEPVIKALCDELTDAVLDRVGVEFVSEFAVPLTVRVIAHALGLPPEDHPSFKRWSDGFEGMTTLDPTPQQVDAFLTAAVEFTPYMTPLIELRRREPSGDVISAVTTENDLGERLELDEILKLLSGLMLAGNETTTGALAGTMMYLVRSPSLQAQLRADPTLIPALVEEGLRLTTPAGALFRTATTDTVLGGARIASGEHVFIRFGAANRDDERFEQPLCPMLDRSDKRHLTFGRGPHVCPGAPLARAVLRIAFETLLERAAAITLSDRNDAIVPTGGPMTVRVGRLYLDVIA
jgi:cytochrome P450